MPVTAGICGGWRSDRTAAVASVGKLEPSPVSGTRKEAPVRGKGERSHSVARVLHAPAVDHGPVAGGCDTGIGRACREHRKALGDGAAVASTTRRIRASIAPSGERAGDLITRIEHEQPPIEGKARRDRHAEQASVPEVLNVSGEVAKDGRSP